MWERQQQVNSKTEAESTKNIVNQRSKYVTQVQQQRPELPTVTPTWRASKCKVHKLRQRYSLTFILVFFPRTKASSFTGRTGKAALAAAVSERWPEFSIRGLIKS